MTALPPLSDLTDNDMTALRFSEAVAAMRSYLAGLFGTDGTPGTALAGLGALVAGLRSVSAAATLGVEDRGRLVLCTGPLVLALPPVADAGAGWAVLVVNAGAGTVTLDPASSETIDGAATAALGAGRAALLVCTGSAWRSAALPGTAAGAVLAADGTAGAPGIAFAGDADTGLLRPGADQIGAATGGVQRWLLSTTALTLTLPVRGADGSAAAPAYSFQADSDTGLWRVGADVLALGTGGAAGLRIDPVRRVIVGGGASQAIGSTQAQLQVQGQAGLADVAVQRYSANATGAVAIFSKSRGATVGTHTVVEPGDSLGDIQFYGVSDTGGYVLGALVLATVESAPVGGGMPTAFRFMTLNTAGVLGERMRIASSGAVGIGTGSPTAPLHVNGAVRVGSFTVATVPSANGMGAGAIIYVSNESGGAVLAFSDGTSWRRVTDRAIIS